MYISEIVNSEYANIYQFSLLERQALFFDFICEMVYIKQNKASAYVFDLVNIIKILQVTVNSVVYLSNLIIYSYFYPVFYIYNMFLFAFKSFVYVWDYLLYVNIFKFFSYPNQNFNFNNLYLKDFDRVEL